MSGFDILVKAMRQRISAAPAPSCTGAWLADGSSKSPASVKWWVRRGRS
jgi:hypothetical protein